MAKTGVYKFHWDCGRNGDLTGVFISTDEEVAAIQGQDIWFGEVLGKHSEVYGKIEPDDIWLISDDPAVVKVISQHDLESGFNPFHYWERPEDEEAEDDDSDDTLYDAESDA